MKRVIFLAYFISALLCFGNLSFAQQGQVFEIPLVGNAFEVGHKTGRSTVGRNDAVISTATANKTSVYFKILGSGELDVKIRGKSRSSNGTLKTTFLGKTKDIQFSDQEQVVDLGKFSVAAAGYQYIDLTGVTGAISVSHILVSGSAVASGIVYCNDPSYYYWARRGPSCHLGYQLPTTGDVSYYYNEVVVPKGEDVIGSYYMANGFAEGYFGMQVNSATERRILFSVWSPFHTDDPKSIPDDQKIVLLKKGKDVNTGEFGNEGSGGQSFMRYNWKAGETYKFLLKGVPDGQGNTDYTAWFFMPETQSWGLIASFKRPKTNTYLQRFHSFLENFNPNQGYLTRKVHFNNQWVYDGEWKSVTGAKLTVDATYSANQRVDATGGKTATGYFLKMGGFFDEIEKPGTVFEFVNKSGAPQIDFSKLP
jgi:hypothetical protein